MIEFDVVGTPAPQGSKTAILQGDRARLIDKNPKTLKAWRGAVEVAGRVQLDGEPGLLDGPLEVFLAFRVERGKTVRRLWPSVRPDLDKYVRATFDALTAAGVYGDDAQVVVLHAKKRYVREGETTGASIRVLPIGEEGAQR